MTESVAWAPTVNQHADIPREIGCGDLENLIRKKGEALWPRVEELARSNVRFRRALAAVWAYGSPEFDRREQLLRELGEFRDVVVRFVVELEDFADPPAVSWRAVEVEGSVPGRRLPSGLREIADWM